MVDEDKQFTPEAEQNFAEADIGTTDGNKTLKSKKSNFGAWLGYGLLVLVLLIVVAFGFWLHELRSNQEGLGSGLDKGDKRIQDQQEQITGLQNELAAVHQELATVQSKVTTEESKFEREIGQENSSFNDKIEAVRSELGGSIQHIQRQLNQTRGDVMVADAEYLLSVANQKLHLVGDVKAVIAMMEAADQRLHDSGDPAVFKVREALAEEINLLKAFNPPDIVGVSAKLLALEGKVGELPLFLPHSERAKEDHNAVAQSVETEAKKSWLDSLKKDMQSLVTIRHTNRPVQAILLPEEVAALRQVLLLKLEMSRSALLRGDEALYKANMDSALAWLKENFDGDAAQTQAVEEEIKSLQGLQLQVPFPDVSKSLSLLRNIEKLRLDSEKGNGKSGKLEKAPETPPAPPAEAAPPAQPANPAGGEQPAAQPQPEAGAKP